jgi:hypothetical protein
MVLIFSESANHSQQISREIERAVSKGIPVVPVRIEEVRPTKSMEYFLGAIHWLDALTPPLEEHLQQLSETVKAILQANGLARAATGAQNTDRISEPTGSETPEFSSVRFKVDRAATGAKNFNSKNSTRTSWLLPVLVSGICAALLAMGIWLYHSVSHTEVKTAVSPGPAPQGTGKNLVINGDFENGNTGFTTAYAFGNVRAAGTYVIGTNPSVAPGAYPDWCNYADHTTGTGNMMIVNGGPSATMTVWEQVVTVNPSTDYTFSYWATEVDRVSQSVPRLFVGINGTIVGISALSKVCPDNGGRWENFTFTWNSGTSQSADLAIFDQNTDAAFNDFALDDISFSAVPVSSAR